MRLYFRAGFLKQAGGPGSGVSGDNTDSIDIMDHSSLISIGKRKDFLKHTEPIETIQIPTHQIKYKGQYKYVPKKLMRMVMGAMQGDTSLWERPVQLLKDSNNEYHIVDGHHRVLAAIILGRDMILAEIYPSTKLEKRANMDALFTDGPSIDRGRGDANLMSGPDRKRLKALGLLPAVLSDEPPREDLPVTAGNPYNDLKAF